MIINICLLLFIVFACSCCLSYICTHYTCCISYVCDCCISEPHPHSPLQLSPPPIPVTVTKFDQYSAAHHYNSLARGMPGIMPLGLSPIKAEPGLNGFHPHMHHPHSPTHPPHLPHPGAHLLHSHMTLEGAGPLTPNGEFLPPTEPPMKIKKGRKPKNPDSPVQQKRRREGNLGRHMIIVNLLNKCQFTRNILYLVGCFCLFRHHPSFMNIGICKCRTRYTSPHTVKAIIFN